MTGLTTSEVEERRARGEGETGARSVTKSTGAILRENICTLFNALNFAIAILLFAVGAYSNMLFIAIIILNIVIGIVQEFKAKKLVDELTILNQPHAVVLRDGKETTIEAGDIVKDDVMVLDSGKQICNDAVVIDGRLEVNESLLTGESDSIDKTAGSELYSGSSVISGRAYARVTHVGDENYTNSLINEVRQEKRVHSELLDSMRKVTRFTSFLIIPLGVLLFVEAMFLRRSGTYDAVVSSAAALLGMLPKGLVLLISVSLATGVIRLAKAKILVQNIYSLETLAHVDVLCLDKTGTLTVKQPQVTRVEMLPGAGTHLNEDHVLMMAGVVETYSVHILAKGIAKAGTEALSRLHRRFEEGQRLCPQPDADWPGHGRDYPVVKHIDEDAGKGISGEVNGHKVRVGRLSFAASSEDGFLPVERIVPGRATTDGDRRSGKQGEGRLADEIRTRFGMLAPDEMASYVSVDGHLIARIVLRDVPRANAKSALASLRGLGVAKLSMLTGDKRSSAAIIASEVGIDDVHAELFPEDKVTAVTTATVTPSRGVTMMVGDGVNDAPVLAAADIGMAMTDGTSTAASESAQVVIMNDDIAAVPRAIAIARRTKRVMLQAVLAGLALALIGMVAAAFNLIPVVVGAFLQEAIDVVSILWALTALLDRD